MSKKKAEHSSFEDVTTVVEDKEVTPTALRKEVRASGVCDICRKRYTDVPVIDGVAHCPNCSKI